VREGDLLIYAAGTANLIAASEVDLSFGTNGEIAEINVQVGDKVSAGDGAGFQEQAMLRAAVRLLRTKIGEVTTGAPGGPFEIVFEAAAEATGLTVEEIEGQMTDGTTLAEILEASGADVTAVRMALIEAFAELPNADDLNLEELADQWLGLDQ